MHTHVHICKLLFFHFYTRHVLSLPQVNECGTEPRLCSATVSHVAPSSQGMAKVQDGHQNACDRYTELHVPLLLCTAAFTPRCLSQLCNVRGEPRWYGQWYPKSCLSSTGHHPTPPNSRLRLHCRQSEAGDCTIRLCWLVHLECRKRGSAF